ncbi:TPA: glycosyltransferase family 2 protein [Candidatus Woesearchaeota archaeon]|nr:glycosyltransferase family 2 protein [Candidatus Woesearchaeota archaeon]
MPKKPLKSKSQSGKSFKLSILMPAYNEEDSIAKIIAKIDKVDLGKYNVTKELIIVDDGSKDRTVEIVRGLKKKYPYIRFIRHKKNRGKGGAIKTAIRYASGDILIVQDADLEYDPEDYPACILPIMKGKAKVVYGSRFLVKKQNIRYRLNWLATKLLNYMVLFLYFQHITDEPTCYKTFDAKLIKSIRINGNRFEWEPEVTAKLCKMGHRIHEVPIKYYPRSVEEGKKINWKDGVEAVWTLIKYRFVG